MKKAVLEKSIELEETYPSVMGSDGKVAFCDINQDRFPELLLSVMNYRHNNIYWFIYDGSTIVAVEEAMKTSYSEDDQDVSIVDVYYFDDKTILKSSWQDWSYKANERFTEYYETAEVDLSHIQTIWYSWWGEYEDEQPTKFYLDETHDLEVLKKNLNTLLLP